MTIKQAIENINPWQMASTSNHGVRIMSTITVNGRTLQTTHQTVQLVVNELGLSNGRYAVEVNGELIPKSELGQMRIIEEMTIEVVQAVGGG
jgi:sulfur carrier protein